MVRHVRAPFILNQLLEAGEAGSTRFNLLRMPQSESGASLELALPTQGARENPGWYLRVDQPHSIWVRVGLGRSRSALAGP